jgi:MFS family permease
VASQVLLVLIPPHSVPLLLTSVALEAVGWALANPMVEAMLAMAMESHERARISAIVYMTLLVLTSPFGWIAGQLSAIDRSLPFALNLVVFVLGMGLVWVIDRRQPLSTEAA